MVHEAGRGPLDNPTPENHLEASDAGDALDFNADTVASAGVDGSGAIAGVTLRRSHSEALARGPGDRCSTCEGFESFRVSEAGSVVADLSEHAGSGE